MTGPIAAEPSPVTMPAALNAATVILVSEHEGELQTLLIHRSRTITFGGNWVFPGGRVDEADDGALAAAVRETREETGIELDPNTLIPIARWTPPPIVAKRFDTQFFLAVATTRDAVVDGVETQAFIWCRPAEALERHARGELSLAPPTWVMVHRLTGFDRVAALVDHVRASAVTTFQTRPVTDSAGRFVLLWEGDIAYEADTPDLPGPRHRLYMEPGEWRYENT